MARKKNYAVVTLDATGSMMGQEQRVVTSMNEYANGLPKSAHLTVFMFDADRWIEFFDGKVSKWTPMTIDDYKPGSMTPLYDSVAKSIKHAEKLSEENDRVMIMIDTDGFENASIEHTQGSIKALVDTKKSHGWEFVFMSGGLDKEQVYATSQAGKLMGMTLVTATHDLRMDSYGYGAGGAGAQTLAYFNDGTATQNKDWLDEDEDKKAAKTVLKAKEKLALKS